ncbi:MAG: rod shape-determining protein MreD [Gammaproteobacteria bacterium]|nr:rod shape-determining protein MreD [Gammaproteobacteria bacterium]
MRTNATSRVVITITLIIALLLDSLPLPALLAGWRPQITLLVLLYWLLTPAPIGVGSVFVFGLLSDFLSHALLGGHALAWLLACWLLIKCHRHFHFHHPLHQGGTLLFPLLLSYAILFFIQHLIGARPIFHLYLYSLLISLLFWPLVWVMLSKVERRHRRM